MAAAALWGSWCRCPQVSGRAAQGGRAREPWARDLQGLLLLRSVVPSALPRARQEAQGWVVESARGRGGGPGARPEGEGRACPAGVGSARSSAGRGSPLTYCSDPTCAGECVVAAAFREEKGTRRQKTVTLTGRVCTPGPLARAFPASPLTLGVKVRDVLLGLTENLGS